MTRANWKIGPEAGVSTRFQCFNIYLWQDSPLNMEGLIGLKDRVILNAVIKPLKNNQIWVEKYSPCGSCQFFLYILSLYNIYENI